MILHYAIFLLLLLFSNYDAKLIIGDPPRFDVERFPFRIQTNEGGSFSLHCGVENADQIQWLRDGAVVETSSKTLTISFASKTDSGEYRCLARNSIASVISPPTFVQIQYFEDFDHSSVDYAVPVVEGGAFVIKRPRLLASTDGVSFSWYKDGKEVHSNSSHYVTSEGHLVVSDAARGSFGRYRVLASSPLGEAYSQQFVVSPSSDLASDFHIVFISEEKNVVLGKEAVDLKFDCVTSFGSKATIHWFLDGQPVSSRLGAETLANRRLTLSNPAAFRRLHSGDHSLLCKAAAESGRLFEQKTIKLRIIAAPLVSPLPEVVEREISASFLGECRTTEKRDPHESRWFREGKEIPSQNGILSIPAVSRSDYGVYQCEVLNEAGRDMTTVILEPPNRLRSGGLSFARDSQPFIRSVSSSSSGDTAIPSFSVLPQSATIPSDTDSHLISCQAQGTPTPTILWKFEDDLIASGTSKYEQTAEGLLLHEPKRSDSGKYTCVARNPHGTESASADLVVTGSSLIERPPTNQSLLIGTVLEIPCEVNSNFRSQASITWFYNNQPISDDGNPSLRLSRNKARGSLSITPVGPESIGEYMCTVTVKDASGHVVKEESASMHLQIIEKPGMPNQVTATIVNDTMPAKIKVSWSEGFDGNSPIIRYSVKMRTMGPTELWNEWEDVGDTNPAENCCSILLDNLRPSVTAEFRVIASNKHGPGKPSLPSADITMPQQPPAAAPKNVAASARSANSVIVQWQKPQEEQFTGNILGYVVRYRLAGYTLPWTEKNITDSDSRNAAIEQLITWQEYEIQVAAYNDRGLGVFSKSIEVMTAEGVPTQAPKNVRVEVLNSTAVDVGFEAPDQQRIPGVNLGYKIQFWKGAVEQSRLHKQVLVDPSAKIMKLTIEELEKFGHYNVTVLCYTSPGDGPKSNAIEVVTAQDVPEAVSSLTIQEVMFDGAFITWEAPLNPNGVITRYVLRFWSDSAPEAKSTIELDGSQRNATISGLMSTTKYSIDIMASTVIGDGPREESKFESGRPPVLPERSTALSVSDVQSRQVNLQFTPGHDGYTAIRQWIVEAKVADSGVFHTVFNISAPKARSFIVTGLRPFTKYQLRIIAENVKGRGAPSEPTRVFETKQTNPETPSTALFAEPVSATSVSLSWTPLLATQWNGQPKGYLILYREQGLDDWKEVRTSSLRSGDFVLRDLIPFTSYEVDLFAENMFGRSASAGMTIAKTYESSPSGPPRNVRADAEGIKSVVVRWDQVPEDQTNGDILGYTVRVVPEIEWLRAEETKLVDVPGEEILVSKISGLRAYTSYHVFVSAYTIVGNGPENPIGVIVHTEEDIPGMPAGVSFSLVSEDEVRLKWLPPDNSNGKIKSYTIKYWLSSDDPSKAHLIPIPSSSLGGFTATDLKHNSKYTFAISAENSIGTGPEAEVQVVTTSVRVPVANPSVPTRDTRPKYSPSQISIRWDLAPAMDDDEAAVRFVQVEYQKANGDNWTALERNIAGDKGGVTVTRLSANSAYRFRIRFAGDFASSVWSLESEWMRTLPSAPELPPSAIQASPYDSSSILMQWTAPSKTSWNSDSLGYRIYYREYSSNESWHSEDIPVASERKEREQFVLSRLQAFRHYIIRMVAFNSEGDSPFSVPAFVYVGYSIPKRNITNLMAEPKSSSSVELRWDQWAQDENDVITGFKVRFVPVASVLSEISHEEEMMVVENNSCLINDLRKFTKYQISVTAYNRAGESNPAQVRIRTLEDVPGAVGNLRFTDVLLDSVRVVWDAPSHPNGVITNYTVNYRTFKMQRDFKTEMQSRTGQLFFPASGLEEGGHYVFTVWAETSAGRGTESTANITVGPNSEPKATTRPAAVPGQSSFTLAWKDPDSPEIIGHLIQAKRVSNDSFENPVASRRFRRSFDFRPSHILGKWVTLTNIEGSSTRHEISYRELEPSSSYVFRIFARNSRGVGQPSGESEVLVVPASIPDEPFYTTWWFITLVAMSLFIVVVVTVACLCVTGSRNKLNKRNSVDSLQLADGNFVTFQMKGSQRMGRSRNDLLTRPGTTQSWLSDRDPPAYGSVLAVNRDPTTGGTVVNMYGLATDVIPPPPNQQAMQRLSALVGRDVRAPGSAYVSGPIRLASEENPRSEYGDRSIYGGNRSEYAYARGDYAPSRHNEYEADSFDDEDESVNGDVGPSQGDIAGHYGHTDHYRETWRKVRDAEGVPSVAPPSSASASVVAESPAASTDSNWPSQQAPNLASGFSSFV